jgi:hypothetical protein
MANATITASGLNGAGIGAGDGASGLSQVVNLTILSGNLTVSAQNGAAIGSGYGNSSGTSIVVSLTIAQGTINATSSAGAGIGSGCTDTGGNSTVRNLVILGGIITANGTLGAGVGAGAGNSSGFSTIDNMTLSAGTIIATASGGAGVGAGCGRNGSSVVNVLIIVKPNITARSLQNGAGIGHGLAEAGGRSELRSLVFSGDSVLAAFPSAPHSPIEATSLDLSNGSVEATVPAPPTLNAANTKGSADFKLVLQYQNVTAEGSEDIPFLGRPYLQIGEFGVPNAEEWKVSLSNYPTSREFMIKSRSIRSFLVSLPNAGHYQISAYAYQEYNFWWRQLGSFVAENGSRIFEVGPNLTFVRYARFVEYVTATPKSTVFVVATTLSGGIIAAITILSLVLVGGGIAACVVLRQRAKSKTALHREGQVGSKLLTPEAHYDGMEYQAP